MSTAAPTRPRVAVTPRSLSGAGHPALDRLAQYGFEVVFPAPGRLPTPAEQLTTLPGCVAYLAGVEPIGADLLRACPTLKVVARNGTGVDNIDLTAAAALDIRVERAVGANAQGVAELAVGLILAAFRQLPWSDARLKAGAWQRRPGLELAGRTLGVVGLGQVGRRVATIASAVGMTVVGHDAVPDPAWCAPDDFRWATLDELLAQSDVVTLHAPPGERPLVDAARLARLREGAVLVNTARAELVDDSAVLDALDSGRLSTYAVDAFATEPPIDLRLVRHDKVIATPHIGGFTRESIERATEEAVSAILRVVAPAPALHVRLHDQAVCSTAASLG